MIEKNFHNYSKELLYHKDCIEEGLLRNSPFESHRSKKREPSFVSFARSGAAKFPNFIIEDLALGDYIIFSKHSKFKKYKDSRVLIAGGGPSTNKLDFSSSERDFLWSCNHFYLHKYLKNTKVDMAMIMGEPDIKSEEFINYRDKFKPMIGFEIHENWIPSSVNKFKGYQFDDYENYFLMHTDFYSKLGAGVRMIIFACALGVKEVSFVGLDGPSFIKKGDHAFQKGKTTLPVGYNPEIYAFHYRLFWKYINSCFPSVSFLNLGYGQEYHDIKSR